MDVHAICVQHVLSSRGHHVERQIGTQYPIDMEFNIRIDQSVCDSTYKYQNTSGKFDYDSVWYRRPTSPRVPDFIDKADRQFVFREWAGTVSAFYYLSQSAFWVNPLPALTVADNKPCQLINARQVGLKIPQTLVSNRPQEIKNFIEQHEHVIYKPMKGMMWESEGKRLASYTAKVTARDLPSDRIIIACPGIYQNLVPKQFEARVQFFGSTPFAIKIDSLNMRDGDLDWRRYQNVDSPNAAPITVPEDVCRQCLGLMSRLGIVSGAFDFIVTPAGDWVFLEVNESGQFLFLEEWCPEIPILDAFCDFITSGAANFEYETGKKKTVSLSEIFTSREVEETLSFEKQNYSDPTSGAVQKEE